MKIPKIGNDETSSPVAEMKQYLVSFIREMNLDTGHALPSRTLMSRSLRFNPRQKEALVPALEELVKDGFLEKRDDSYFLTELGREKIY